MVEIPEHLRKRAEEARAKAEAAKGGSAAEASKETEVVADTPADSSSSAKSGDEKIPSHLLDHSSCHDQIDNHGNKN